MYISQPYANQQHQHHRNNSLKTVFSKQLNRFAFLLKQQQHVVLLSQLLQHLQMTRQLKKIFVNNQRCLLLLLLHQYVLKQYLLRYHQVHQNLIIECFHGYLSVQQDQSQFHLHRFVKNIPLQHCEYLQIQQSRIDLVRHKLLSLLSKIHLYQILFLVNIQDVVHLLL